MKSINKILEGKRIFFPAIGELKIYKRINYLGNVYTSQFKNVENALHGYYYYVILDGKARMKKGSKFFQAPFISPYIRDIVLKENLDLPLYNRNEYKKTNKHKKRSTEHV
jgi:hypothetical protein